MQDPDDLKTRGARVRTEVLGGPGGGADASATRKVFQEVSNVAAWGAVWGRPGLGYRDRCLVTVTSLAALGQTEQLPMHMAAALRHGVTVDEMVESLLHVGLYAGFPKTSSAFQVLDQVLAEQP